MQLQGVRLAGSSLLEVLVSLQLAAVLLGVLWPVQRILVAASHGGGLSAAARMRAIRFVQSELEYLRTFDYARFRDPSRCALSGPPPFPPTRILPEGRELGEPDLPAPLARAEVRISDEAYAGEAPDGCAPRRVWVVVYGAAQDEPLARGALLRVRR